MNDKSIKGLIIQKIVVFGLVTLIWVLALVKEPDRKILIFYVTLISILLLINIAKLILVIKYDELISGRRKVFNVLFIVWVLETVLSTILITTFMLLEGLQVTDFLGLLFFIYIIINICVEVGVFLKNINS